nr:uncharacterized mitochondrial protein AtMg00810-like [Tanacetum cinerariifolium]
MYRGMIGSLLYLTASMPDIMFSVCLCARFQEDPKVSYLEAVKMIFRYIKRTQHIGLWYPKDTGVNVLVYANLDHASYIVDRKSTSGICTLAGSCLTSWFSKKETSHANSITESDYVLAERACRQALWMKEAFVAYNIIINEEVSRLIDCCYDSSRVDSIQGPCYNQDFGYNQPPFYSPSQPQQFDCCQICGGPHYSFDCQTRNQLIYEPNHGNNYDFPCFDQPPQYHIDQSPPQDLDSHSHFMLLARENNRIFEELLRTLKTHALVGESERSNDFTEAPFDDEKILRQHNTAHVTPLPLAYILILPILATMDPLDTFLMRDEVIRTISKREDDEFTKSSIDDLVPIPRESELILDSIDLECSMPIDPPLPCTDVLGDTIVDIDLLLGEHLDTLSIGDTEIDFNPIRDIE